MEILFQMDCFKATNNFQWASAVFVQQSEFQLFKDLEGSFFYSTELEMVLYVKELTTNVLAVKSLEHSSEFIGTWEGQQSKLLYLKYSGIERIMFSKNSMQFTFLSEVPMNEISNWSSKMTSQKNMVWCDRVGKPNKFYFLDYNTQQIEKIYGYCNPSYNIKIEGETWK